MFILANLLSPLQVSDNWQVLFPLAAQIGSIIGVAITSPIARRLGIKKTVLVMLGFCAAFITIPFLSNVPATPNAGILFAGYFLQGIPWGVFQVLSPGYSSEIASLQLRPILTTWNNLCWVIGQFLAAGVTAAVQKVEDTRAFKIPFAIQWVFVAILLVAVTFVPESPYWYLEAGRISEARSATKRMVRKGSSERTEEKLALMRHTLHQESNKDTEPEEGSWQRAKALFKGTDLRRTEIACITWAIQAMCGSNLIGWAIGLFESAGMSKENAANVNIAVPGAGLVGTMASWWLMQYWGRRKIYFWGLVGMAVLLIGFALTSLGTSQAALWAGPGIFAIYTLIYDLTVGPVCYPIVSEIPSIRRRTSTLSAARGTYLTVNLVNYFLTPKMIGNNVGQWNWGPKTGYLYAGLCILGAVYTWFRLPEPSGVSARELDILFQNNVKTREFSQMKAAQLDAHEQGHVTAVMSHSSIHLGDSTKA